MEEEIKDVWVSQDRSEFSVYCRGVTVEFCKEADGEFYIAMDGRDGEESLRMTAEQFDAFKRWIMG